eukprot:CAMPEP_0206179942 /NCGR_PEP_ID=MMETSP1474-20131121/67602_1 /ASSEMBLY_ACC=CAM_ASM_001110 /TAXON_ID=97495 /ORGANISM="Imantonia sp., Strain RCC918" /LENGTH=264 /DNA_ID=CAMNT_0053593285 /DNA_START=1011 /DNA_END=1803 /DNA_ORIENTATION=-
MEVKELTVSDRTGGVRDAGGHLGGKEPDLKNMAYHCCLANEGDLFIAVSDGVHDNLDPEVLKCSLAESGCKKPPNVSTWADCTPEVKNELKRQFKEDKLLEIIESADDTSPYSITNAILKAVEEITMNIEKHMKKVQDYKEIGIKWEKRKGDLFIAVSDGVHDNLDPEVLKCPLSESGFEIPDGVEDWEDLNTIEKNEKKRRFKEEKLLEIIESVNEVSPRAVTDAIISEIEEITRAQRKGYEEGSRLQRDWDKMGEEERNKLN